MIQCFVQDRIQNENPSGRILSNTPTLFYMTLWSSKYKRMPVFSAELQLNLIYIQRLAKLTSKSIFCDKIFQLLYSPIGVLLNNAD